MTSHVPVLRRRRLARTACAAVALVAAASLAPAVPALARSAKARPAVTNQFFGVHHQGMHADGPIGWPQTKVGSVRMWDNRVSWRELETSPGVFNWSLIDTEMAKARAAGASVLLVLGQTPAFHSSRPGAASSYGPGASAMPDKASWVRYVQAVARRNKTVWGGIASFVEHLNRNKEVLHTRPIYDVSFDPNGSTSFFGFIKRDSTPPICSRKTVIGNRPSRFTVNWRRSAAHVATRPRGV